MNRSLILELCIDYFPAEKLFIYDYGIDFQQLKGDLGLLDRALGTSPLSSPYCMDVVRDYTCNYVYPGCSNETGLPQGICTEECQTYVTSSVCSGEFNTLATVTDTGRLTFRRQCDNTLLLLEDFDINTSEVNQCDCINITGMCLLLIYSSIWKFYHIIHAHLLITQIHSQNHHLMSLRSCR